MTKILYIEYQKTVDAEENTLSFKQEIYNEKNILVEIHEKYPIEKGHVKIGNNDNHETTTSN